MAVEVVDEAKKQPYWQLLRKAVGNVEGWRIAVYESPTKRYAYYIPASGKRLRSIPEVRLYLRDHDTSPAVHVGATAVRSDTPVQPRRPRPSHIPNRQTQGQKRPRPEWSLLEQVDYSLERKEWQRYESLALEVLRVAIESCPSDVLFLTGAGVEVDLKVRPTHRCIARVREVTPHVGHITTNISGLQLFEETQTNFVAVHRTIFDGQCQRRKCGKIFRPRSYASDKVPTICACGGKVYGCVPCGRDNDSDDWKQAAQIAAGRKVLVVLGNSLDNARNGTGLKWMREMRASVVVVVDPHVNHEQHQQVWNRLNENHLTSDERGFDRILVVQSTADAFMTQLAATLGVNIDAQAGESRFMANHKPPALLPGYDHQPTIDVLRRYYNAP